MPSARRDFLTGVNLPWISYGGDFGANAWSPSGGIGAPDRAAGLDQVCSRLADRGLRHVRWFMLCDGRAGLAFDSAGRVSGLDPFLFRDVDAAVAAATRHALSLTFVLFDFTSCHPVRTVNGVRTGGLLEGLKRREWQAAVLDRAVQPILQRYGREPAIAAWDLFNEPEWVTFGCGTLNLLGSLWPWTMHRFLRVLAALVHAETGQNATVGLGLHRGRWLLHGVDLDFYQLHWYDKRSRFLPDVRGGWHGKPVLLGEFPTRNSARGPLEIVEAARARGYCGALGWSALAADEYSQLDTLEDAVRVLNA
jgi:hypothetical protein